MGQRQNVERRGAAHEQRTAWLALTLTAMALLVPGPVIATLMSIAEPALEALRHWKDNWWPWPVSDPGDSKLAVDKIIHLLLFAICAILALRAWLFTLKLFPIILLLLVFAGLTEVAQHLVPGRSMSFGDMIADTIGILTGAAIWQGYRLSQSINGSGLT